MGNTFLGEIFSKLDMVVLEQVANSKSFELLGQKVPDWFMFDESDSSSTTQVTQFVQRSDFLKDFLKSEAEPFWRDRESGECPSEPWEEEHQIHGKLRLKATALAIGQRKYLMIKKVGQEVVVREALLQEKRARALREEQLSNQQSDKALHPGSLDGQTEFRQDDISVMLDKLRIGALMIDQEERIVFVNKPAKRVLGFINEGPVGCVLWEACSFRDQDRNAIQRYVKNSDESSISGLCGNSEKQTPYIFF